MYRCFSLSRWLTFLFMDNLLYDAYQQSALDWLRAGQPRGRSLSPGRGQEFSLLHVVQTGFGVHPTSYPMGTGGSFPGGKAAGK
jgi:hypothetical protein